MSELIGTPAHALVDDQLNGIGLTGIWGSEQAIERPREGTARERAEVWFDRV
jgi:hypothetical protein